MDDEDFEVEDECGPASYPWNMWVLVIAFFQVLHSIAQGFKYAAESLLESSVAAANHEVDRKSFEQAAREDIESIVSGGEDG